MGPEPLEGVERGVGWGGGGVPPGWILPSSDLWGAERDLLVAQGV